jgi:cation:H+ antiporter
MNAVFIFISGAALLIYSAERLIVNLIGTARGLGVSVFLLAIIFTGIEFDDLVLGVVLNLEGLGDVALGTVVGTTIAMSGVVLALAAIIAPSRADIPRDYIVLFAAAPLVMVLFVATAPLTPAVGAVLLALFVLVVAYIATREIRRGTPIYRHAEIQEELERETARGSSRAGNEEGLPAGEPRSGVAAGTATAIRRRRLSGWAGLGLAVLALAGLIIGAATMGIGTEEILEAYNIEATLFGATIATAVLTLEDIFLTVEPARKGVPQIGIGNVIGSVIFSVTGKLGIILLAGGSIAVGADVLTWHLPVLVVVTGLAACFLSTGRLRRWHGYLLLACYVTYWVISFAAFGGVPIELD